MMILNLGFSSIFEPEFLFMIELVPNCVNFHCTQLTRKDHIRDTYHAKAEEFQPAMEGFTEKQGEIGSSPSAQ